MADKVLTLDIYFSSYFTTEKKEGTRNSVIEVKVMRKL